MFYSIKSINEPSDLAEVKVMKSVGVRTSHIMNYLKQQAGGIQNVGFTSKDLYNHLNMVSKAEIFDGDVVAVIAYFQYWWWESLV